MEAKKIQVSGIPLIKFQSAERISSLQQGHLYAKTLKYDRNREQETGDRDIGDDFEAMLHINEGYIHIPETDVTIELNDALISTGNSEDYVFCMFGISPSIQTFRFTDEQKSKMLSFGDTALVIQDSDEFIKRVLDAAKRKGYEAHFGTVQYYDPSIDGGNSIVSLLQGMWNIAYWKRKRYSYQQEKRFVFTPGNGEDHIDLDIGDISDISTILPASNVLSALIEKQN